MRKQKIHLMSTIIIVCMLLTNACYENNEHVRYVDLDMSFWSIDLGTENSLIVQPKLYEDSVYIQTETYISSYDINTGNRNWKTHFSLENQEISSWNNPNSILVNDNNVFVDSKRKKVYVFDKQTGEMKWVEKYPDLAREINDMMLYQNMLIISRHNSFLAAYNDLSGDFLWGNSVPSRTEAKLFPYKEYIILATLDSLVFYDINNGVKETYNLNGSVDGYSLEQSNLFVVYDEGECTFSSLNIDVMENNWCTSIPFDFSLNNMNIVYDNSTVYFFGNHLYALNKDTGEVLWEEKSERIINKLYIVGEYLYIIESGFISKLDKTTGEKLGSIKTKNYEWQPIIINDTIIVFEDSKIISYENPLE